MDQDLEPTKQYKGQDLLRPYSKSIGHVSIYAYYWTLKHLYTLVLIIQELIRRAVLNQLQVSNFTTSTNYCSQRMQVHIKFY